jgi:hypothetical protein
MQAYNATCSTEAPAKAATHTHTQAALNVLPFYRSPIDVHTRTSLPIVAMGQNACGLQQECLWLATRMLVACDKNACGLRQKCLWLASVSGFRNSHSGAPTQERNLVCFSVCPFCMRSLTFGSEPTSETASVRLDIHTHIDHYDDACPSNRCLTIAEPIIAPAGCHRFARSG